jgi:hypothetical protein
VLGGKRDSLNQRRLQSSQSLMVSSRNPDAIQTDLEQARNERNKMVGMSVDIRSLHSEQLRHAACSLGHLEDVLGRSDSYRTRFLSIRVKLQGESRRDTQSSTG